MGDFDEMSWYSRRGYGWGGLVKRMTGKVSSLMALAAGKLPKELLEDFCDVETGLFPKSGEMKADGPEAKRIPPPKLWSRRHEKPVVHADLNVPTIFNRKRR